MPANLDEAERRILRVVQEDAGLTTAAIAERVGLSPSPCWRRIDRLEKDGVIRKRVTLLDRKQVGLNAHIFAQVKLTAHGRAHLDDFSDAVRALPEVLECYVLMGPVDFLMRIVAEDIEAYEAAQRRSA